MSDTVVSTPPPAQPRPPDRSGPGDKVRFVLRGLGQTLVTAGVVVLLFVVYEVWITNIFAERDQARAENRFQTVLKQGKDPLLALPGAKDPTVPLGDGIANLYIPRLGSDYHPLVVQGSAVPDDAQLQRGAAHYRNTALPGDVGNFAIAGHRVGKGEPFLNLDKLRPGDAVIVETKSHWWVYRVKGQQHGLENPDSDGVPGREIVDPSDGEVVLPVPNQPGKKPTEALLTMTTCTPKFSASQRMIVHAVLDGPASVAVSATSGDAVLTMPPSIKALYSGASS